MTTKNLLVELFVEELPPKALKKLGEAFSSVLADSLKAQGLAEAGAAVTAFATLAPQPVHRPAPIDVKSRALNLHAPGSSAHTGSARTAPATAPRRTV